jgi:hypothetical protein
MQKVNKAGETVNYYINNAEMLKVIRDYREKCRVAAEEGKPKPQMPDYIGEKLYLIAEGLAKRYNFIGYSFIDEMKLDAIENCIAYFHNFNPDKVSPKTGKKYDNPHAYFTMVMWNAFVRRIQTEKKETLKKHKMLMHQFAASEGEEWFFNSNHSLDNSYMDEMVAQFEATTEKKKRGRPKKVKTNETA